MKNNKGITLTSLIIYMTVMFVVLTVIMRITTYFSKNINDAADVTFETEFEKFNLYMLEETNKKGNNVINITENGKKIEFKDGNIFTFAKENEDEIGKIYLNNNIKVCENVNDGIFHLESNTELSVSITINEVTKNVKYAINSGSILPAEYQEVEYIESTGTQYIDTKKVITTNSEIECVYCKTASSGSTYATPFGSKTPDNGLYTQQLSSKNYTSFMNNYDITYTSQLSADEKRNVIINIDGVWEDGKKVVNYSKNTTQNGDSTITLFARNYKGTIERYGSYRIYSFIWRENGIEVLNLIPCYRKPDQEIGFYDLVNDTFYSDEGLETLKKGYDVIYQNVKTSTFAKTEEYIIDKKEENQARMPSEYQEVEYIESTGTQYIDTEYVQKNNPRIEAEIMLTSTSDLDIIGNSTAKAGCFIIDYKDKTIYYRYGTSSYTIISYGESIINKWTKCIWGSNVYHDGTLLKTVADQDFSTNTQTLLIGKGRTYGKVKFKEVKIFDNNVLVRNLIPCYRKADNVVGMYDLAHDVFYTNSGTGEFIAGPEI